jgi:outer membrane biosynthesis protein TonB
MAENESGRKDEFHFIQLVMMFQTAAMQQMGKLQNPITKKVERDLHQVRFSIDMLEMIQNRTKNNLSENEKKFLEHTLYELRMNYLDEVKKEEQKKTEKEPTPDEDKKDQPEPSKAKQETDKPQEETKESAQKEENKKTSDDTELKSE